MSANSKSPKELKLLADKVLIAALERNHFYKNEWNFDPMYVRRLLQTTSLIFGTLSLYSILVSRLSYHWMFISFFTVLASLLWYWYYHVECGGGRLIFSRHWKDSFVLTVYTETNYVIQINIAYTEKQTISIPFSAFKLRNEKRVSSKWLAREIAEQLKINK